MDRVARDWGVLKMKREMLKRHLNNVHLLSVIKAKLEIDKLRKSLISALNIMAVAGISSPSCMEVQAKIEEYRKISKSYSIMLEDAFEITWQEELIILKHQNCTDREIDMLPSNLY